MKILNMLFNGNGKSKLPKKIETSNQAIKKIYSPKYNEKTNSYDLVEKKINAEYADSSTIEDDERPYYQPDEYYTLETFPGREFFNERVVTFEERKKVSYPSKNGLYVAEILLLYYCDKGQFPKPKNGYQGFWWFEYGIRDIGHALENLEQRGFLKWGAKKELLKVLSTQDLKNIAKQNGIKTNQKKENLITEIQDEVQDEYLPEIKKYQLTEKGKQELKENEYIPNVHNEKYKNKGDIWRANKAFYEGNIGIINDILGEY